MSMNGKGGLGGLGLLMALIAAAQENSPDAEALRTMEFKPLAKERHEDIGKMIDTLKAIDPADIGCVSLVIFHREKGKFCEHHQTIHEGENRKLTNEVLGDHHAAYHSLTMAAEYVLQKLKRLAMEDNSPRTLDELFEQIERETAARGNQF